MLGHGSQVLVVEYLAALVDVRIILIALDKVAGQLVALLNLES